MLAVFGIDSLFGSSYSHVLLFSLLQYQLLVFFLNRITPHKCIVEVGQVGFKYTLDTGTGVSYLINFKYVRVCTKWRLRGG